MQALSRPFHGSKHFLKKYNWKLNMEVVSFEIKSFYDTLFNIFHLERATTLPDIIDTEEGLKI